jgi:hypothetical protein
VAQQRPALAEVTEVTGSAYGFFTSVSLFDGPAAESGPAPVVTLPPEGSAEPITETAADEESVQYGPAIIVQSTAATVSTEGTTGPDGSVTSSAELEFDEEREEQVDPFKADALTGTCTASESGTTGTVTLTNGSLVTSTDPDTEEPVETVDLPAEPAPNTSFTGTIDHVGDTFRLVLNEQILEDDTLTVNAVHLYLGEGGDGVAQGDAILGQSVCGVDSSASGPSGATPSTHGRGERSESEEPTRTERGAATTAPQLEEVIGTTGQAGAGAGDAGRERLIGAVVGGGLLAALIFGMRRPKGQHRR